MAEDSFRIVSRRHRAAARTHSSEKLLVSRALAFASVRRASQRACMALLRSASSRRRIDHSENEAKVKNTATPLKTALRRVSGCLAQTSAFVQASGV